MEERPAWSSPFAADALRELTAAGPIGKITREWAWGGSTGKGVRVAVVDSGIEEDHPAVRGRVKGGVAVLYDGRTKNLVRYVEEKPFDPAGHGTACAGIICALAPEVELYAVRVLGRDMTGRAMQFASGLRWAINNGMHVANLSLSTSRQDFFGLFHEIADEAYFKGVALVSAVNNIPEASYPSLYSSVISVAANESQDPFTYHYNPAPPVEFGAPGIEVRVPWNNHGYIVGTGNSFAAPHIAGLVALIRSKHPLLSPFQIKTVLFACASNTRAAAEKAGAGRTKRARATGKRGRSGRK